jgi:DNA-binding CsgD family transcriptional regulator
MSASICIQIISATKEQKEKINFFIGEDWSPESESQLLHNLKEILAIAREYGLSLQVNLDLTVRDTTAVNFLLNKKINKGFTIRDHKLSIREVEILGLIMQGLTNHEIAEKLFISYETVKSHRKNILEKTGAKNTAALINYYHETFFEK